jgi:hypothetical protein
MQPWGASHTTVKSTMCRGGSSQGVRLGGCAGARARRHAQFPRRTTQRRRTARRQAQLSGEAISEPLSSFLFTADIRLALHSLPRRAAPPFICAHAGRQQRPLSLQSTTSPAAWHIEERGGQNRGSLHRPRDAPHACDFGLGSPAKMIWAGDWRMVVFCFIYIKNFVCFPLVLPPALPPT